MIITLEDAKKIDPNIMEDDLQAFESAVRRLTNNNFQQNNVRFSDVTVSESGSFILQETPKGLREGDTIELNYSHYNDGLYVVDEIVDTTIKVDSERLFDENSKNIIVTLVQYPPDIKRGIKKLIQYDLKMGDKVGIKSETISRMSKTYYDVNATDNTDGYPKSLLSFLDKYEKMRWGS